MHSVQKKKCNCLQTIDSRFTFVPTFFNKGVDYFGPLLVKQGYVTVKHYGCIFTCLTMRVHIKIAHSLDSDSFINALRRFIAHRGKPKRIFSDNGTNFVGATKTLRDALLVLKQEKIQNHCIQQSIKWHFNPPTPSHYGGA